MTLLVLALDAAILTAAFASAYFWWAASRRKLRRMSRSEELDAADINRIVTVLNRTQILNARAALCTAVAAVLAGMRLCLDLLAIG